MDRCEGGDRTPKCTKHIIHLALKWREQLESDSALTRAQVAAQEGISRARVTQVMSLLAVPVEAHSFLGRLTDLKEIRFFSERRLRRILSNEGHSLQRLAWEELVGQFKIECSF